ncbi:unnamed protein product, partial [Leptidea sinapis]
MLLIVASLLYLVGAYPQNQVTVNPNILVEIFGTPSTTKSDQMRLEDITVKPTEATSTFTDKDGNPCQYGEDDNCQETVELCCKNPITIEEVKPPKPDPKRPKGCGYSNPKGLDFQLTGGNGNEAQFGEFPWVVALLDALNESYVGVGVLLHPQIVMTAAHKAASFGAGTLKVRAGEWDTQTNKERLQAQERVVVQIEIRNEQPLELAEHINVICLPSAGEDFSRSKNCVANGWGKDLF